MVLQIFTDAGQGVDQRNIKLAQEFRIADPGTLQNLRRGDGTGAEQHFFIGHCFRRRAAVALQPLDANGAFAVKNNVIGHGMGADGQVRAAAGLIEIAAGGTGATSLWRHGAVHRAKPFLLITVEIVSSRIARLHAGFHHRMEQRIIILFRRSDAHRTIAAVIVVGADIAGFRFPVIGQAVEVAPVFQSRRGCPVIKVHGVAADVAHAVNQRGAAEPFTASALHAAVVHIGFRFGLIGPVIAFAL